MLDRSGRPLEEVPGGGWEVFVQLPADGGEMALLTRLFD